jgi:hypothetical protein
VHTENPAVVALQARRERSQEMSLIVAAIGAGVVVLIGLLAMVLRRGRRRGWRPAEPEGEPGPTQPAEPVTPGRT